MGTDRRSTPPDRTHDPGSDAGPPRAAAAPPHPVEQATPAPDAEADPDREGHSSSVRGPTPEESWHLIQQQTQTARTRLDPPASVFYWPWGITYLVGLGVVFLALESSRLVLPAAVLAGALGVAAAVITAVVSARSGRGTAGPARRAGAMYGACWGLAFLALFAFNAGLSRTLDDTTNGVLWPGSCVFLAGVLYLVGGALGERTASFALGAWMVVVAAASVFAGSPGNLAVLSLAGGGGLLVAALFVDRLQRRSHRREPVSRQR